MGERKIGVAMDFSASSKKALRWTADNLLRKGDTLVLLHIQHRGRDEAKHVLWSHSGSPLIPLEELKDTAIRQRYDIPADAEVFNMLEKVAREKELSVVLKLYWGDPREKVCGGGAQPRIARHGQPWSWPNPEDSSGKCHELRLVECILPGDRRQGEIVIGIPAIRLFCRHKDIQSGKMTYDASSMYAFVVTRLLE